MTHIQVNIFFAEVCSYPDTLIQGLLCDPQCSISNEVTYDDLSIEEFTAGYRCYFEVKTFTRNREDGMYNSFVQPYASHHAQRVVSSLPFLCSNNYANPCFDFTEHE